jgi:hypothetical protein
VNHIITIGFLLLSTIVHIHTSESPETSETSETPSLPLSIKNFSGQQITIFYRNKMNFYKYFDHLEIEKTISLDSVPQSIIVHFNKSDVQHKLNIEKISAPLIICSMIKPQEGFKLMQGNSSWELFDPQKYTSKG